MISYIALVVNMLFELLRVTVPIALFASLLSATKLRYFLNGLGIILVASNLTVSTGLLLNQSAQDVVLFISIVLLASALRSIITHENNAINKLSVFNFVLTATFVFILPSLAFFLNSPELFSDYIFWLKRSLLVLFFVLLGCLSTVVTQNSVRIIIIAVFIINCIGVIASFFAPELFLILVDADDPMLQKGLNPMGGGFYLNPNGAALAVVFSYLAVIYIRNSIAGNWFVILSFLFFITLSTTGSRGGFLCGVTILVVTIADFRVCEKSNIRGIAIFLISISLTALILMNFFNDEYIGGFSRIIDVYNEGNLASNNSRWDALVSSMNLVLDSPFIGSGFGLRNKLLETQPHNMFVAYAIDIGMLGLLAFPAFIITLTKIVFKGQGRLDYRVTSFAILFMGLFDHDVIYSKQFAYLMFVALAVSNLRLKETRRASSRTRSMGNKKLSAAH